MQVQHFEYVLIWWIMFCARGASQAQNLVNARIEEPLSLVCALKRNLLILRHLAWYRCSHMTEDQCRGDWDKYRIGRITDMRKVIVDHPERYKLDKKGYLTIKQVMPEDDKKIFICRWMTPFATKENKTVLEIIKEAPKITTSNPIEHEIIEGMPLMLEFKVDGYPYPLVSLRHNQDIVLNGTKMDPIYIRQNASKLYLGDYTCFAENSLGNASITIKVKVLARAATNSSCQGNGTAGTNTADDIGITTTGTNTADDIGITTTDESKESSESPSATSDQGVETTSKTEPQECTPGDNLNTEGDCNCKVWKALFIAVLLAAFVVALKKYLNLRCHHNTSQSSSGDFELVTADNGSTLFACNPARASRPLGVSSEATTPARSRRAPARLVERLLEQSVPASQL